MELIKRKKITQKLNFRRNFLKYQSLGIKLQKKQLDTMSKLQRTFDKDIKQISPQPSVSATTQLQIKNQTNRLFMFFKQKSKEVEGKLQQQKINVYSQIVHNIIETVKHRQKAKKIKLNKINKQLQQLYKHGHKVYQKIILMKSEELQLDKQQMKQKIQKKQQEKQSLQLQISILRDQKIVFLRLMLKNGYYMHNGIEFFFQKMIQTNYKPSHSDFPDFLDQKTIQYLMIQYYNLEKQKLNKKLPNLNVGMTTHNQKQKGFQKITTNRRVKSVYDQTKNYISDWIKKQGWKNRSLKHFIPVNDKSQNEEQKYKEAKRMKQVYDKVTYPKAMKITFGITKYQKKKLKRDKQMQLKSA